MIRPVSFGYNEQTAANNDFMRKSDPSSVQDLALNEFESYRNLLSENNVDVVSVSDTPIPHTPDSIFPNNWFSTHEGGVLVLYPMFAPNRREERKDVFIKEIKKHFSVTRTVDLTAFEKDGLYLEGTGSMVLDREHKIAYACRSPRTSEKVLEIFCKELGYTARTFDAVGQNNIPIYHTNVLMSIAGDFAVICPDCIKDKDQRNTIMSSLQNTGKDVMEISLGQMEHFAGNVLEIKNMTGNRILVMSETAIKTLTGTQLDFLTSRCRIISPDINTIEQNGGGSARCMLAELF